MRDKVTWRGHTCLQRPDSSGRFLRAILSGADVGAPDSSRRGRVENYPAASKTPSWTQECGATKKGPQEWGRGSHECPRHKPPTPNPQTRERSELWPLLCVLLVLAVPACKHRKVGERQTAEESGMPNVSSVIHMGDPRAASQLASGFHDIEAHAWRWTMRTFAVYLRPPLGSAQKGAVLYLNFTLTPPQIEKLHSVTLSASVNGNQQSPETWDKPGDYVYRRDVPAGLMTGDSVRVDFELDKAVPPSDQDARELGVVVSKAGLELK